MEKHAFTFIGWTGQEVSHFELPWEGRSPALEAVRIEGPAVESDRVRYIKSARGSAPGDVTGVSVQDGVLKVEIVPLTTRADFSLVIGGKRFNRGKFVIHTRTADDKFARLEEGRILYRLYTPDLPYPRLFSENHASWVPTYSNEYGIMSWLLNQHTDA